MDLVTIDSLAADGAPRERASRLAQAGELTPVRPGAYVEPEEWLALTPAEQHVVRVRAALLRLGPRAVFGLESAALLHGIPLIGPPPERPCVLVPPRSSRSSSLVRRIQTTWSASEVELVDGIPVTTPLRTALDIAAEGSPLAGVIAVSDVRHRLGVGLDVLTAACAGNAAHRGIRRVERAVAASSDRSESPLEALVLTRIRELGFAEPEQQRPLTIDGRDYRVDFAWLDGAIILEADGRLKYRGPDAEDALWREKRREDAIRSAGPRFARVTWSEAWDGDPLEHTLLALAVPRPARRRPLTH